MFLFFVSERYIFNINWHVSNIEGVLSVCILAFLVNLDILLLSLSSLYAFMTLQEMSPFEESFVYILWNKTKCLSHSQLILAITHKSCMYSVDSTKIAPVAASHLVLTHRLIKEILVDLQTLPPALSQTCWESCTQKCFYSWLGFQRKTVFEKPVTGNDQCWPLRFATLRNDAEAVWLCSHRAVDAG